MSLKRFAHITSRYPCLTETFIRADMEGMRPLAEEHCCFCFYHEKGEAQPWFRRVHRVVPGRPYLRDNWRMFWRSPARYLGTFSCLATRYLSEPREWFKAVGAWSAFVHFACEVERTGCQGIHAHWSSLPATAAWVASRLTGVPMTHSAHAFDIYKRSAFLREKLRDSLGCLTSTGANKVYLESRYPEEATGKIHLAYYGVEVPPQVPPRDFSARPFVLVSAGRMWPKKGFPTLLRALGLLRREGCPVRLRLLALSGPMEAEIRAVAKEEDLGDALEFVPPTPHEQMPAFYASGHACVLPCEVEASQDRDGLPNVLLEAAASGLPLVSTPISAIPELLKEGQTGLFVPERDPVALAAAVRRLIEEPGLAAALGAGARQYVEAHFERSYCQANNLRHLQKLYGHG